MAAPSTMLPNGTANLGNDVILTSVEPSTPKDDAPLGDSSQIALPSTEIPNSPIDDVDPNVSFKTELNDDRDIPAIIPSSLTPPPSSQVAAHALNAKRSTLAHSQASTLFSPPATVQNTLRNRGGGAGTSSVNDYLPPNLAQIQGSSADELRNMLQTCIGENQKLKTESAHHKLHLNLLNLQAANDLERAAVEHDMIRAEVDAIRSSEYFIQTKRELSAAAEAQQVRYQVIKEQYEVAVNENKILSRRMRSAKKVIMQKEEEIQSLVDERDMLLNRIRENREHFQTLCSPGGILYGALTPSKPGHVTTPQQASRTTPRQGQRNNARGPGGHEHGLSALLQAMSQDNNSAPSTPLGTHRPAPRQIGRHHRNVQSLSSLPTTPLNRVRGGDGGLLPSVSLVPQTEPPARYTHRSFLPSTPKSKTVKGRKSRESTISADENEELARQAILSANAAQSFGASDRGFRHGGYNNFHDVERRRGGVGHSLPEDERDDMYDSQATQAATEMLRRDPRESFEVASSLESSEEDPGRVPISSKWQASNPGKRSFSGVAGGDTAREQDGQSKKLKASGVPSVDPSVGLGIQYRR